MAEFVIEIFWLLLPAAFANMAPVLFGRVPILDIPVDFGISIGGQRIFGGHKTWRGLLVGILAAILIVKIQSILDPFSRGNTLVNYKSVDVLLFGLALGGGALFGDLIKSFFKRLLSIPPGKSFVIVDQIDWIIGALAFSSFFQLWSWSVWATAIILFGTLHPIVNLIGYWLKIKPSKF